MWSYKNIGATLAVALILVAPACGGTGEVHTAGAADEAETVPSGAEASPVQEPQLNDPSARMHLQGDSASVLARVTKIGDTTIDIEIDRVLSGGRDAERLPDRCNTKLAPGGRLTAVEVYPDVLDEARSRLEVGNLALFIGDVCEQHRDGELGVVGTFPNGRLVGADGTIDLGDGDVVTVDEAAKLAGSSWADVAAVPQLAVTASFDKRTLTVDITGTDPSHEKAKLGVSVCDVGVIRPTSPDADIFGCDLMVPRDFRQTGPILLDQGRRQLVFDPPAPRIGTGRNEVLVFGDVPGVGLRVLGIVTIEL